MIVRGTVTSHVQCGLWPTMVNHLAEEFEADDVDGITDRWSMYQNGGGPMLQADGYLSMHTRQQSNSFPFLASRGQPIPPAGEFSVRWLARYTQVTGTGTGSLLLSTGLPVNGSNDGSSVRQASVWQDNSGFDVRARDGNGVQTVQHRPPGHLAVHDIEYCWLEDRVEVWVDGEQLWQAPNTGVTRPNALWAGNSVTTDSATTWSNFDLFSVRVRKPFSDPLFGNGFD